MTVRLAFIRHGHTAWNRLHKIQGSTDIPLDDEAREGLAALRLPDPWASINLWSSPLSRARETAELISGTSPQIASELTEMNWGDWEGLHGKDLLADPSSGYRNLEDWGWDFTPPNGESPADVRDRLRPWLHRQTQDGVVVAHMGTMRAALALAHGWDFTGPCPFTIKRNRLFVIEGQGDTWTAWPDPIRLEKRT